MKCVFLSITRIPLLCWQPHTSRWPRVLASQVLKRFQCLVAGSPGHGGDPVLQAWAPHVRASDGMHLRLADNQRQAPRTGVTREHCGTQCKVLPQGSHVSWPVFSDLEGQPCGPARGPITTGCPSSSRLLSPFLSRLPSSGAGAARCSLLLVHCLWRTQGLRETQVKSFLAIELAQSRGVRLLCDVTFVTHLQAK